MVLLLLRLGRRILTFLLLFFLELFLLLRMLILQLLRLRLVLLLDLLLFSRVRLLLGELRVFLLLLLLNFLSILCLISVKLIQFLLVLPVQLAVRRGLDDRPRGSRNLVRMNGWRRSGPIGLRRLRSDIRIAWAFRRAVSRRFGGRLAVRRYRLAGVRIRIARRGRPVGAMIWCRRRVIRCRRPIGLHWFRSDAGVRGTVRWAVSRRIVGLHGFWRRCLRRLIHDRGPIGLHWLRSFAETRGMFCRAVCGMVGKRYRFVAGSRGRLRGLHRRRLNRLRLAWPVRYGHWGRNGLGGRSDVHRCFPVRCCGGDLLHLRT
jgi:hypothetical protein